MLELHYFRSCMQMKRGQNHNIFLMLFHSISCSTDLFVTFVVPLLSEAYRFLDIRTVVFGERSYEKTSCCVRFSHGTGHF
jgi:hypothetical protein